MKPRILLLLTLLTTLCTVMLGCVTEPTLKSPRQGTRPDDVGDGWSIATPAAEGFDERSLGAVFDRFFADTAHHNAVSLLIVRRGRLVAEAYARGAGDRTVKRNIQSATKSVTSLVFGIARARGHFADLDQPLSRILPEKFGDDPRKRAITLRHLLTMRSGIAFDNDDFSLEMLVDRPRDPLRYILAKPLDDDPGARFSYRDADPQLLSGAVQRETGRTLEQLAREHLFAPLGITDFFWQADPEGTTLGPFALFLRPRDMARIGQLVLQRGRWNGVQLIPADWVRLSTSAQTGTNRGAHLSYGYYWWVLPELDAFAASGQGGNFIFVAPAKELVVVMTSLPHASDEVGTTLDGFLPLARGILGALR